MEQLRTRPQHCSIESWSFEAPFRCSLRPQCLLKTSEMVIAMTNRVILEKKLAGQRCVGVERNSRRSSELFVGQFPDGRGGRGTIATEQFERLLFRDASIVVGMTGV